MDPAQSQLAGYDFELRSIVTNQQLNDRDFHLGMVSSNSGSIQNMAALLRSQMRQMIIKKRQKYFLAKLLILRKQL